jgi:pimeloyl-ACP methyl ester carboxylesterase
VTLAEEFAAFVARVPYTTVALPWGEARVWELGEGRPVVMLHGIAGGRRVFFRICPLLAERRHVIVPPLRGEDRPLARMGREELLDDVAALLESLGLSDVTLFGFSFGAHLALAYAARNDPRVRDVVVAGGFVRYRLGLVDRLSLALSRVVPAALSSRYFVHRVLRGRESRLLAQQAPGLETLCAHWMGLTPFASLRARVRVIVRPGIEDVVRRIRVPLVVGHGELDPVVPVASARLLAELHGKARLKIWPEAAHISTLTHVEEVSDTFLGDATD